MRCHACGIERADSDEPCKVCGASAYVEPEVISRPEPEPEVKCGRVVGGAGCLSGIFSFFGVLFLIGFFVIPVIVFIPRLIVMGIFFALAKVLSDHCRCSECGNKVDGKKVKICPTCKVNFE